ncbi:MAG TPA: hypothetical protein VHV10_16295 [Ktedonobacteraceae bacterium]|jgi:hypothetical protein|nr:hypothetical protein [Ktedonobacteraceae bacterium]
MIISKKARCFWTVDEEKKEINRRAAEAAVNTFLLRIRDSYGAK